MAEVPNTAGAVRSPTASQYNVVTVTFFEGVAMADLDLLEGFKDEELPGIEDLPPEIIIRNEEGQRRGFLVLEGSDRPEMEGQAVRHPPHLCRVIRPDDVRPRQWR